MDSISIIIVTYNSENEIKDCLESVFNHTIDINYKIIIVDNNSSDNTVSIINKYNNKNISLISNKKNLGYTKANNQSILQSKGDYLLFLNPDTILHTNSIFELVNEIKNDNTVGAIAPQLKFTDGRIQKSCRRFPRRRDIIYELLSLDKFFKNLKEFKYWKMEDFDHSFSQLVEQPAGAALLIRKNVIDQIGLLDDQFPMFFSDVDLCKRIIDNGSSIKFTTKTYITHKGGSSIFRNRTKMILSSHLSFLKYFRKYKYNSMDSLYNIFTGIVLILLIPIRVINNLLTPKSLQTKRQSL